MAKPDKSNPDEFTYHRERARSETLAALAAANPRVAAIHVELATRHVLACAEIGQVRTRQPLLAQRP